MLACDWNYSADFLSLIKCKTDWVNFIGDLCTIHRGNQEQKEYVIYADRPNTIT